MDKKEIAKKAIALLGAGVLFVGSAFSCSMVYSALDAQNQKPYDIVVSDMEKLNVDSSIARLLSNQLEKNKFLRLKMDEDRPVIVDCDETIKENQKEIISEVVDYYNSIFATINENYKFKLRDENTNVLSTDTIIKVKDERLDEYNYGNHSAITIADIGQGNFFFKSDIKMDWKAIEEIDIRYGYYVFLHEMGHALGLGDVYYQGEKKNINYLDMRTMMQYGEINDKLFPNDYALLQALYSNEYSRHDNYEDAIKVVNEKIEQYTYNFYYSYAQFLKENRGASGELLLKDLSQGLTWNGIFKGNEHLVYELDFKKEICVFTIKNKNGEVLEKTYGKAEEINGVVFIRGMYINKASNYTKNYSQDYGIKLMLSVYKSESGELMVRDTIFNSLPTNLFLNKTNNNSR